MPIFEFHCRKCGEDFEEIVSLAKLDGVVCPSCYSKAVSRLLSRFALASGTGPVGSPVSSHSSSCAGCTSTNCGSCRR